jgi:hypothetical protein
MNTLKINFFIIFLLVHSINASTSSDSSVSSDRLSPLKDLRISGDCTTSLSLDNLKVDGLTTVSILEGKTLFIKNSTLNNLDVVVMPECGHKATEITTCEITNSKIQGIIKVQDHWAGTPRNAKVVVVTMDGKPLVQKEGRFKK